MYICVCCYYRNDDVLETVQGVKAGILASKPPTDLIENLAVVNRGDEKMVPGPHKMC